MKTLLAATLILASSLAGAETKAKQDTPQTQIYQSTTNPVLILPGEVMTQPADDNVMSITILLDIDGYLLNTLSQKYSGLDPAFDHLSQLYSDTVNLYSAAIAKDGDMDFAETRKSAKGLFVEEMLLLRVAKDKQ